MLNEANWKRVHDKLVVFRETGHSMIEQFKSLASRGHEYDDEALFDAVSYAVRDHQAFKMGLANLHFEIQNEHHERLYELQRYLIVVLLDVARTKVERTEKASVMRSIWKESKSKSENSKHGLSHMCSQNSSTIHVVVAGLTKTKRSASSTGCYENFTEFNVGVVWISDASNLMMQLTNVAQQLKMQLSARNDPAQSKHTIKWGKPSESAKTEMAAAKRRRARSRLFLERRARTAPSPQRLLTQLFPAGMIGSNWRRF